MIVDPFQFTLHLGDATDGCEFTETHDGDEFRRLAIDHGVQVCVTAGCDPRRARPDDLAEAAASRRVVGALVPAFGVEVLT